jgi:type IV pilus assembly protein PilC
MATKAIANPVREFTFTWEGRDRAGKTVRGEMRAGGEAVVNSALRRQGILVTRIQKRRYKLRGKIRDKDITLFTRQLSTMLRAGVPLLQSFDIVAKGSTNGAVQKLFTDIRSDVETGTALSQAFRKYPLYFDSLYCNLVGAGEQAGILDDLLDRLAAYKEKMQAIRGKVKSALFYPAAVLVVAIIVTIILLIFVIPQFESLFKGFGADLPAFTQFVINMSRWLQANGLYVAVATGGAFYAFFYFKKRSKKMRETLDRLVLKMPIIGPILEKAAVARFARTLSTMFAAGVPLVEALESVAGATGNIVYENAVMKMRDEVATGQRLQQAMANTGLFPNMVIQMVAVGEESGALDEMSGKVATFYEADVDNAVDSMSSLLEPLIMAILGVLVGGLVIAMYLPIFKLGAVV